MAPPHDAPVLGADAHPAGLGILGGTFNPPHRGHIALARHAREELLLERVLLMPARLSPGKPVEEDPGPGSRLEMCRLALADVAGVGVCAREIEREGPSYTVDTLRALHASHPGTSLTLILGADVARTLPAWREAGELLALAGLAVALRAGAGREEVSEALAPLLREAGKAESGRAESDQAESDRAKVARRPRARHLSFLSMPPIDVSSSIVRERVRCGLPVEELVGSAVASHIAEHGLYRAPIGVADR